MQLPLPTTTAAHPQNPGHHGLAQARWHLRLLGAFVLNDDNQQLTRLASRRMVVLLARLALAPERDHPREALIELLWPEVAPERGRARLRQVLSNLRAVLEPPSPVLAPVLLSDRHNVRLVRGAIDCDVLAFEQHAREGRVTQALAVYGGDLLPGFFDDWILAERHRLEALSLQLADQLALLSPAAQPASPSAQPASQATANPAPRLQRAALPVYLTRHFMSASDLTAWQLQLAEHRFITLLGPGGSGKTRLAVELAQAMQGGQRAAFVSLVACRTRAQALDAMSAGLGASGVAGQGRSGTADKPADELDTLRLALHGQALLLVLDNFEQLVDQAADIVATLAQSLPQLRLLVTSRRALGVDGERVLAVPALALPATGHTLSVAYALGNPAVALFIDRVQRTRSDYRLGEQNKASVVALVRVLEGLPLAIELAASRVRSLAPARILELLKAGEAPHLELLARSGPRGAHDARHASMEHVIRWSWDLLSDDERHMLQALTVFNGGCTLQAAAAVRGLAPLTAALALDGLVACSMLRAVEGQDGEMRFQMDEPIREFAQRTVDAPGAAGSSSAPALRAAHRRWMLVWAETLPVTPSLPSMRAELANLSMVLRSALADGDAATAVRIVLTLAHANSELVLSPDALADLEQAVLHCNDAELRGRGHTLLAQLFFSIARGNPARHHAALGAELVTDKPGLRAWALYVKARLQWLLEGHAPWLEPAIANAQAWAIAAQDNPLLARITVLRAAIAYAHSHDLVHGEALYRQALALWEGQGNQHLINAGRYFVALIAQEAGRHAEAIERLDEVLASARRLQDTRRVSQALQVRGKALCALRRWDEAAATLHESVQLAWDGMAMVELTRALRDLPRVLAHRRRAEAAVRLQAFAAKAAETHIGRADQFDQQQQRLVRRLVAGRISDKRWTALRREGEAMSMAEAVAMALTESAAQA